MKQYFIFFAFFIIVGLSNVFSQNKEMDSLKKVFSALNSDTARVRVYHEMFTVSDNVSFSKKALFISKKNKYIYGCAISHRDIGRFYFFNSKKDLALYNLSESIKYATKINDKKTLSSAYRYLGYITILNDPFLANKHYQTSLKFAIEIKDPIAESYALSAIGNVYEGMILKEDNFKIALNYYLKSLKIREKYGDDSEIASSLNETARIYNHLKQFDKSAQLRFRGLEIAERSNDQENIENLIFLYNSIGNDFIYRLKDYKTGLKYEVKAYEKCLTLSDNVESLFDVSKMIANCYDKLGNVKLANKFYAICIENYEIKLTRANKYDYSLSTIKHELEDKLSHQTSQLKNAEILKQKAEVSKQKMIRNFSLFGVFLLLIIVVIISLSYKSKKEANIILDEKNHEIVQVTNIIESQKQILEESNLKLKQLLLDKELLFKEVHHRVKNNLQIISSLLNLQSYTISDQRILDILKQSQSRINTMAILHNKLYQTEDFSNIPFDEYLKQLTDSISNSFIIETCDVKFVIDTDSNIKLNIDVAIPFGLILNELITNSFKHAFIGQNSGLIYVSLNRIDSKSYHFIYKDNGVGLPENYRENISKSLGLELIEMLVAQLHGTIQIKNEDGGHFDIVFNVPN